MFFVGCLIVFNSSCSRLDEVEKITFEVWHNGSKLSCNEFKNNQQVWTIQQLAFFISDMKLSNENTWLQPQLTASPWQASGVVLMQPHLADCDIQANTEDTIEGQNAANIQVKTNELKSNSDLHFATPVDLDSAEKLTFTLAVPFALNHQNPLLQPSPLNLPNMFWSWQSGHKFFRLDMQGLNKNWVFHLGSVGCTAVSAMRSPQEECVQPNRVGFVLDKKHNGAKIVMHLDRLLVNISLQDSDACLFHSDQSSCSVLMDNLSSQNVFEWH